MNGDISRVTFNPFKYFTRVVLQQGRVQTDADGNEQTAILLHHLRTLAADLIGQHGGPQDVFTGQADQRTVTRRNCGFAIIAALKPNANTTNFFPSKQVLSADDVTKLQETNDRIPLRITTGHYYVDGLLAENDEARRYSSQPYLVRPDNELSDLENGIYLFYLDVWERLVTALDEPSIREVALGGADTAARTQLIWQVKIAPDSNLITAALNCANFGDVWPDIEKLIEPKNRGRLTAMAKKNDGGTDDVCITAPEARYRGIENQLYRVEVHRGGPAEDTIDPDQQTPATFKWSRDNGTVVATIKRREGDRLIVSGLRDFSRWFTGGQWVEITHEALELTGRPGTLVRLAKVEGEALTIDPFTTSETIYEPGGHFEDQPIRNLKVRRWDHVQPDEELLQDGAIPIKEGVAINLEDGVQIQFEKNAAVATQYRSGDYWLIPARVATGDVEWPKQPDNTTQKPLPAQGVEHHYAPLALVTIDGGHVTGIVDLRHKFPAAAICE
jgi:hypothetical protein